MRMGALTKYLGDAGRWAEIPVGLFALAASAFGLFFGARGFIAFAQGSHAAWADPVWCSIGIVSGLWLGFYGTRLVTGSSRHAALLPNWMLLFWGLVLIGAAGLFAWDSHTQHQDVPLPDVIGGLTLGAMALRLWWRRVRGGAA